MPRTPEGAPTDIVGFSVEKVKLTITVEAEVLFPLGTDTHTMVQWTMDRMSFAGSLASCVRKCNVRPLPIGVIGG